MFSIWSVSLSRAVAAGAMTLALSGAAVAAPTEPEVCAPAANGRCDYTVGREGAHRIDVTLPAAAAAQAKAVTIGGHDCPLIRQADTPADGGVHLACFAYLAGGTTYSLSIPMMGQVTVVRAEPAHGEPVTLIP